MPKYLSNDAVEVRYVKGYASLARFIASDRDNSTAIYRRFDHLAARNLLYLQSELVELEAGQAVYDAEDLKVSTEEKESARNWRTFKEKAEDASNVRERQRMELALEIRRKLKEYREAIVLESTLIALKPPSSQVLEAFRNVFHNISGSEERFPLLGGQSADILDDADDLMALAMPVEEDRLTTFLRYYFPMFFITQRTDRPLAYISERRIYIVVAVINVLLAAALLFGAIYNLYYVRSDQKRLGLIAGYTTMFAVCVGLLTKARRSEVFAACAAYAAVLVVFVSGNLGSSNS